MSDKIEHQGVIESITDGHVRVSIMQVAACGECKAKAFCTSSDSKEKYVDVYGCEPGRYRVGDVVKVCGTLTMGRKAVQIAFLWPMLIVLATGFVTLGVLQWSEPAALGMMFLLVAAYFVAAWLCRDRLERKFAFWIEG